MAEKSDYELQREERIARNQQQLQTLNVPNLCPEPSNQVLLQFCSRVLHLSQLLSGCGLCRGKAQEACGPGK